jgi:hypothetical protein
MAMKLARNAVLTLASWGLATAIAAAADSTLFDLDKDLALFFKVQAEIQATDPGRDETPAELAAKKARRAEIFRKYGIRDDKHWEKESHAGMRYAYSKRAERIYGGEAAVMDMRRAAGQGMTLKEYREHNAKMDEARSEAMERLKVLHDESAFDAALLAPVDGVSLEKYAAVANAAIFHGDDWAAVAKETGIGEKKFEQLGEKWTERMRSDPTQLLMKKYGGHLFAASRGRYAAAGKELGRAMLEGTPLGGPEPIPFEKWVEVTEYYGSRAAEIKGPEDVSRVLKPYDLTFYEWNIISNWWGRKRTEMINANDRAFLAKWATLREKYRQQFAGGR